MMYEGDVRSLFFIHTAHWIVWVRRTRTGSTKRMTERKSMDLKAMLDHIEGKEELIKKIEAQLGRDYVPRTEFNAKNQEVRALEKQVGDLNESLDKLSQERATYEERLEKLNEPSHWHHKGLGRRACRGRRSNSGTNVCTIFHPGRSMHHHGPGGKNLSFPVGREDFAASGGLWNQRDIL